jgi:hypothetical protein
MQTTFLNDEKKSLSGFNSLENRQILLNIMSDIGLFDDISDTYITFITNDLEDKINTINLNKSGADTIVKLNKRVITEMMTEINKYKMNTSKTESSKMDIGKMDRGKTDTTDLGKTDTSIKKQISFKMDENNSTNGNQLITSFDIRSNHLDTFNKEVTRTKEDFNKFSKRQIPNNIDFTIDVNEKPEQSEMINLYNKAILLRDQDLNVEIPEDSKKNGSKWINRELNTISDLENIQKLQNKYIKISKEDAKLDNVIIQNSQKQRVQEPRVQEPRVQEPRVQESRVQESRVQEPRMQESRVQESRMQESRVQESRMQEPSNEDSNKKKVSFNDNFLLKMKEKYVKNDQISELSMDEEIKNIKTQLQIIIENQNQILSILKN